MSERKKAPADRLAEARKELPPMDKENMSFYGCQIKSYDELENIVYQSMLGYQNGVIALRKHHERKNYKRMFEIYELLEEREKITVEAWWELKVRLDALVELYLKDYIRVPDRLKLKKL